MLLLDVKDFRQLSDYPVPVVESDFESALDEAGVVFTTPLSLRFRIKDVDPRFLLVKGEPIGKTADDFRINVYLPPFTPNAYMVEAMNAQIRHQLAHIAQVRAYRDLHDGKPLNEMTDEMLLEMETEANMLALTGQCIIINAFSKN